MKNEKQKKKLALREIGVDGKIFFYTGDGLDALKKYVPEKIFVHIILCFLIRYGP